MYMYYNAIYQKNLQFNKKHHKIQFNSKSSGLLEHWRWWAEIFADHTFEWYLPKSKLVTRLRDCELKRVQLFSASLNFLICLEVFQAWEWKIKQKQFIRAGQCQYQWRSKGWVHWRHSLSSHLQVLGDILMKIWRIMSSTDDTNTKQNPERKLF